MPNRDDAWLSDVSADGVTPLSDEEKAGLKPSWIATRADLNAAEIENIVKALGARRWRTCSTNELLDDLALRQLHKAMFNDVWRWAGEYRLSEKNIGCDPRDISTKVRDLCADAPYWLADKQLSTDEAGCKFHHELVTIHPFSNGNGRHSRAATDVLMQSLGLQPFTWGRVNLVRPPETRNQYISALRAADAGDYRPLSAFVRS